MIPSLLRPPAVAALLCLLASGCRPATPPADAAATPARLAVTVSEVLLAPVPRTVVATGTLFADEDVIVATKVPGRVIEVLADLGDEIEAGDLLAIVDPVDAELSLEERRLALEESLTRLGLGVGDLDLETDPRTLPAVQRASRQAENARRRLDRAERLLQGTAVISEQDYADLATAAEVAEQDHRLALLAAEAAIAEARTLRAQIRTAEQRLLDTRITAPDGRAPASGVEGPGTPSAPKPRRWAIAERFVGSGAYVAAGTGLFRLVDPDPLKLRVPVPEQRVQQVARGAAVEIRSDGDPAVRQGRVSRIAPAIDPRTRTFEVEVLVPNPDRVLRPGGFARAEIAAGTSEPVVLVPADAVVSFAGVEKVLLVEEGRLVDRRIERRGRSGELVEIARGLRGGELVVRRPTSELLAGTPADVVAREPVDPPPAARD